MQTTTQTPALEWTARRRGAFRNHYAFSNGLKLAVYKPTVESDGWEASVADRTIPALFPTIAAAKSAATVVASKYDGLTVKRETLAALLSRQSIVAEWMRDLVAAHGEDAEILTLSNVTSFGTYIVRVEVL